MRRLALIVLLVAAAAALAAAASGCGGGDSSSPATSPTATTDTTAPGGDGQTGEPAGLEAAIERAAASGVPVRIPPALLESPPAGAEHAEVLRSPPDSYTLGLATKPRCRFKSTCIVAIFSGFSGNTEPTGRKLKLAAGIEGVYEPGRCGPGCEFGTIAWEQEGASYGVGVPEASVAELTVLANEAIEAAPAEANR